MATNNYVISLQEDANKQWGIVVLRDPATLPVDKTTTKPTAVPSNRVGIPGQTLGGTGYNGIDTLGGHPVTAITAASAATPIVVTMAATAAAQGIAVGDYVYNTGVLGNTNANGTFEVSAVSGSDVTLKGSAGNAAYTSGGYLRKVNKPMTLKVALQAAVLAISNDKSLVQ